MNLLFSCLLFSNILHRYSAMMSDNNNRNAGNYNSQPYVVGILSPSTTLYIDQIPTDVRDISPPNDLNLRRRNNNSFQITSVTVQGSRKNDDFADDSADDLDETSHTDDLSSDFLDSSRADNEGYHSEDIGEDLCSPCAPIIFATQLSTSHPRDSNMNLGMVGVTPTFTAIGPVAGGVTMMTSKSESPISAQVPIMNPLPDNWQRRFKVVKIVSSEPFRRGRWLCMDFKDPPAQSDIRESTSNGTNTPPTIQITNCDVEEMQPMEQLLSSGNFAQVYEIPINQTFNGNFVMGNQQQMYGIILPQSDNLQPVTLVQDMSLQTALPFDRNFNNLLSTQNTLVQQDPLPQELIQNFNNPVATLVNSSILNQSPPASESANNNYLDNNSHAVLNHINSKESADSVVPITRSRTSSDSNRLPNNLPSSQLDQMDTENSESSQTAPEKIPSSELEHDSDPSAGSAASTGANTVAIDNKIEQAMDLVKSHLMFAVREEVEVLKEKITELLERISQLEHENDILRANASAETLKQLSNQKKSSTGGPGKAQQVAALPPSN